MANGHDQHLATQVLDLMEEVVAGVDADIPVRFEELSAEPGKLPRMMLQLKDGGGEESRYISGEVLCPMPFNLTLRIAANDQQECLDAAEVLSKVASGFLDACVVLDGYVAYKRPTAGVPYCLGRAEEFEDWQVSFDLKYKRAATWPSAQ